MSTTIIKHKNNCDVGKSKGICKIPLSKIKNNDEFLWKNCEPDTSTKWGNDQELNQYCKNDYGPAASVVKINNVPYREKSTCGARNSKGLCKVTFKSLIDGEEEEWTNEVENTHAVWNDINLQRDFCRRDLGPDSDITPYGQIANPNPQFNGKSIGICKINRLNKYFKPPSNLNNPYNPRNVSERPFELGVCDSGECREGYYLWKNELENSDSRWNDKTVLDGFCKNDFGQEASYQGSYLVSKASGTNVGKSKGVCYVPPPPVLGGTKQYWATCVPNDDAIWNNKSGMDDYCWNDFGYGLDENGNVIKSSSTTATYSTINKLDLLPYQNMGNVQQGVDFNNKTYDRSSELNADTNCCTRIPIVNGDLKPAENVCNSIPQCNGFVVDNSGRAATLRSGTVQSEIPGFTYYKKKYI